MKQPLNRPAFLSADWRNILFANYIVDPKVLTPLLPPGTELDINYGNCYISLVAFQFLNTKVFGIPTSFIGNFDEINLRFYVKKPLPHGEQQSGVVFIKEIVPSRLIAWVARTLYGENYTTMRMSHEITNDWTSQDLKLTYKCGEQELSNKFYSVISPGSEMDADEHLGSYITEHYWGYSTPDQNKTIEYEVKHPKWPINKVSEFSIDFDFEDLYGTQYRCLSQIEPASVFYCSGSSITVHLGNRIKQ